MVTKTPDSQFLKTAKGHFSLTPLVHWEWEDNFAHHNTQASFGNGPEGL